MRIPSSICISGERLEFGGTPERQNDCIVFESIKMRVAVEVTGESTYYFGPATPLPDRFSAFDLAVLTVWYLISEGHRAVDQYLRGNMENVRLGMTMGVPMSFFDDQVLKSSFLSIARMAWLLYREEGLLGRAIQIEKARSTLDRFPASSVPTTPDDQVRDWLRSEGEAAMWWPFQSPAVGPGPYAKIDIGAGTTHASLYRIYGDVETPKTGIAFFGASTVPVGMDAVDHAIAKSIGHKGDCLSLRGKEQLILRGTIAAQNGMTDVRDEIYHAYRRAWILTYQKIGEFVAEKTAWSNHKIFMIGGGSLVPLLVEPMKVHPGVGHLRISLALLEPPPDLVQADGNSVSAAQLPFAAVAYGLANIGLSIPEALTPTQVAAMPLNPARRVNLDRDDIYAK
jgi:hypothetical protein